MAAVKPMLGDIELELVQRIEMDDDQLLVQHSVPALEGDFLQGLGRRAARLFLAGVMTGPNAGESLKTLRDKFRAAEPTSFVADIATATRVDEVLIEELTVRELAGKPERFEYALRLRELITPPKPVTTQPPPPPPEPPPPMPSLETGTLIIEATVEGVEDFDFSRITMLVEGTKEDGSALSRTITDRSADIWTAEDLPPGKYTAKASANASPSAEAQASTSALSDSQAGNLLTASSQPMLIQAGQAVRTALSMQAGAVIAKLFTVHFRFNKAFIEPCEREVLRQVSAFAKANTKEKIVIIGHTDKTDDPDYNQSLSERRARSVFAYLTAGLDLEASVKEWDLLRAERKKPETPTIKDNWGVREYQHMLQAMNFYPGQVNGKHDGLTDEAVRAFRCQKGLPPGKKVDDQVWTALIRDYLKQDSLAIPPGRFFPNCENEIVQWIGCGEEDPIENTEKAFRPSRRVEIIFVRAEKFPCDVPKPDTLDLPKDDSEVKQWCVGPASSSAHCCIVSPFLVPGKKERQPCSTSPGGPWCREPVNNGTLTLEGSIKFEDDKPRGKQDFIITTPGGEFLKSETGKGEALPARTDADGNFSFPDKPAGVYSLEVLRKNSLVRLAEADAATVRGNVVCKVIDLPATGQSAPRLDVVIVKAPFLREIRLPVVAHLMTAKEEGKPGLLHSTKRTAADIKTALTTVNEIWRQARVRFELVDVVEQTYVLGSIPGITPGPEVSETEFFFILAQASFPDVINLFLVHDVGNPIEGGWCVSFEDGTTKPGCAVEDLIGNDPLWAKIIAHELGHFLNLKHPEDAPKAKGPFSDRLMHGGLGSDTQLIEDEVQKSRASKGASIECQPLELTVTNAVPLGGKHSGDFIAVKSDTKQVTIEATGQKPLLDRGPVTWKVDAQDLGVLTQATISRAKSGPPVVVTATAQGISKTVRIFVVDLDLKVEGALAAKAPGTFVERRSTSEVVKITATIKPELTVIPSDLIGWKVNDKPVPAGDNQFEQTVSREKAALTTVSATIGDTTISRTIIIINLALSTTAEPFEVIREFQRIEGVINDDLLIKGGTLTLQELISDQDLSRFVAVADIPGPKSEPLKGTLTSKSPAGQVLDSIDIEFELFKGDRFKSKKSVLAIPSIFNRSGISTVGFDVIRAQAGGVLEMEVKGDFAGLAKIQTKVQGRVVRIFAVALDGSGMTRENIEKHIATANRVWAQAGIEVRTSSITVNVPGHSDLLDLDHQDAFGINLTPEERRLIALAAGPPTGSGIASDLHVYYVRSILEPPNFSGPKEEVHGIAFPNTNVVVLEGPQTINTTLAHEMGHQLSQGHEDSNGNDWSSNFVMHPEDKGGQDVAREQLSNVASRSIPEIIRRRLPGNIRIIVYDPPV